MKYLSLALLYLFTSKLVGQSSLFLSNTSVEEKDSSYIILDADLMLFSLIEGIERDTLIGNVEMRQDSLLMLCHYATVIDQKYVQARGNIVIIHRDSMQIFADSLRYNGVTQIAHLFGKVIMQEGNRRLYTSAMSYDVKNRVAEYKTGGTLVSEDKTLISKEAVYASAQKIAHFKYNVTYRDSVKTLESDSLRYLYELEQLEIISPTRISTDSTLLYCESGVYRTKNNQAVFSENVQIDTRGKQINAGIVHYDGTEKIYRLYVNPTISDSNSIAKADTIYFYENSELAELRSNASYEKENQKFDAAVIMYHLSNETYSTKGRTLIKDLNSSMAADGVSKRDDGTTLAIGNVILADTKEGVVIQSENVELIEDIGYMKAYSDSSQVLMIYAMSSDSLYLTADTLINIQATDSTTAHYSAYYDVRLAQSDFSAVSDSFSFVKADSLIHLFGQPILWKDSTQMTGDTVVIQLANSDLERIDLIQNAMIITADSLSYFDQIKARNINVLIEDRRLMEMMVKGNGEMIFYVKSKEVYRGINSTKCNQMHFEFNELSEIEMAKMYGEPESQFYEYNKGLDMNFFRLDGFSWEPSRRPDRNLLLILSKLP